MRCSPRGVGGEWSLSDSPDVGTPKPPISTTPFSPHLGLFTRPFQGASHAYLPCPAQRSAFRNALRDVAQLCRQRLSAALAADFSAAKLLPAADCDSRAHRLCVSTLRVAAGHHTPASLYKPTPSAAAEGAQRASVCAARCTRSSALLVRRVHTSVLSNVCYFTVPGIDSVTVWYTRSACKQSIRSAVFLYYHGGHTTQIVRGITIELDSVVDRHKNHKIKTISQFLHFDPIRSIRFVRFDPSVGTLCLAVCHAMSAPIPRHTKGVSLQHSRTPWLKRNLPRNLSVRVSQIVADSPMYALYGDGTFFCKKSIKIPSSRPKRINTFLKKHPKLKLKAEAKTFL